MAILGVIWYLLFLSYNKVKDIQEIKGFDPYVILGVEVGDDVKTIKRSYRRMSLENHPDKNPDDPIAK